MASSVPTIAAQSVRKCEMVDVLTTQLLRAHNSGMDYEFNEDTHSLEVRYPNGGKLIERLTLVETEL